MPQTDQDKPKILSKNLFPVVGIGASAGGLDAFKKFVKNIPTDSGMAYIIVQHLHPGHDSALPEILQRETQIPVREISDNIKVKPDEVYIIPSNKMLVATDGILQLSPRDLGVPSNMPIDIFFTSLADVHQDHAIGIVLSGSGADGTIGLKKIKDKGGVTFAQDIGTAAYTSMPQTAINAEVVDYILAPADMPNQLIKLQGEKINSPSKEKYSVDTVPEGDVFTQVISFLRSRKGVDFKFYKQTTIQRRILRRQAILKFDKTPDYLEYLKNNKGEQEILFNDLLIPVTGFFRDPKTFEVLPTTVFPTITKNKSSAIPVRIWIAGCSTGEEAYSMAICLHEYLTENKLNIKTQLFATDISEKSILKARKGLYHKRDLEGLSDARLHQYFTKCEDGFQVKKSIRDMCVFASHNFLKDPPFAKIDLISCRNVLIYMETFLQKKAITVFHYALNEKGFLLLGRSETVGNYSELFLQADKTEKLYSRKAFAGRFMNINTERSEVIAKEHEKTEGVPEKRKEDFHKSADEILLSKYTPPAVIVNDQLDIVQFRGSTGEFLEPSPGKASLNVLKMARQGLSFEIRSAINKAKTKHGNYIKEGIPIDNGKKVITLEVVPLLNTADPHYLILFKQEPARKEHLQLAGEEVESIEQETRERNIKLEHDLQQVREDMRHISDDQEASNEELQSANEELMSGNEELQSLNEELETSKEELQSTNEELITVNQELFDRNEQLNLAKIYAETIFTTVHEPLVILNSDFRVNNANKTFYKMFSLTEDEVIGNVLFSIKNNQWEIPELRQKLERLHEGNEKILEWEVTFNFPEIGERSICFNAQPILKENGENWIMLAFNDITQWKMKQAEDKTKDEAKDEFISIASHELKTPLTTAKVYLQLLQLGMEKTNDNWKYAQKAAAAIDRLNELTEELLDLSRIQNGKLDLKISRFDCNAMLEHAIEGVQVNSPDHKIIKTGDVVEFISGDQERLKQVVINLLTNAVKYSPGAQDIILNVEQKDKEVCVSVQDKGIGIRKENIAKIFERYYREEERSKHFPGIGIGLTICHDLIEKHNGKIWAVSEVDKGSTFYFTIPI